MKTIIKYKLPNGKIPFDEWFNSLAKTQKSKVLVRLERLRINLYGDYRNLKKGISELKIRSGERIYFYEDKEEIVLLLEGGNKQRQSNDIKNAQIYLEDYLNNKNK